MSGLCLLCLAGFSSGATRSETLRSRVDVRIRVTSYRDTVRHVQSFTLTCKPTGGTLPLAARICQDVAAHPKAMLNPPRAGPHMSRSVCGGSPWMPQVSVTAKAVGTTRTFSGSPGCNWPGGQAFAVYFDAATNNTRELTRSESELRCDEDPVLFRVPTPLASVVACRHGLWTPRSEQLIKIAATTPELTALQASKLFPHDFGALPCAIHAGGAYPGRNLAATCGVTVKNVWSTATVAFTEDWSTSPGSTGRHIWHVVIKGTHVIATSQSGDGPPQLWP